MLGEQARARPTCISKVAPRIKSRTPIERPCLFPPALNALVFPTFPIENPCPRQPQEPKTQFGTILPKVFEAKPEKPKIIGTSSVFVGATIFENGHFVRYILQKSKNHRSKNHRKNHRSDFTFFSRIYGFLKKSFFLKQFTFF